MNLLLTNDDGIGAPGLLALQRSLDGRGHLTVVAPSVPLSGCSHQVTTKRPLHVTRVASTDFAVDGTPADCVRLALTHLAPDTDAVIAGVNEGANLGVDVFISGTIAAVREATVLGKRAIAFSQYRHKDMTIDWSAAQAMVCHVLDQIWSLPLAPGAFWNVNFPQAAQQRSDPEIVFCPVDLSPLPVLYEANNDTYEYRGVYRDRQRQPGTDVDQCLSGRITVSQVCMAGPA